MCVCISEILNGRKLMRLTIHLYFQSGKCSIKISNIQATYIVEDYQAIKELNINSVDSLDRLRSIVKSS